MQLAFDLDTPGQQQAEDPRDDGHYRGTGGSAASRRSIHNRADETWLAHRQLSMAEPRMSGNSRLAPEVLAKHLRDVDGLGEAPVPDLHSIFVGMGIIVGRMPDDVGTICAFSCWFHDRPLMLLRQTGSVDAGRLRFDAAHELGHLLMHRELKPGRTLERQANQFAGSWLIPAISVLKIRPKPFDWGSVNAVCDEYGVTAPAVVQRMRELGLLSPVVYQAATVHALRLYRQRASRN